MNALRGSFGKSSSTEQQTHTHTPKKQPSNRTTSTKHMITKHMTHNQATQQGKQNTSKQTNESTGSTCSPADYGTSIGCLRLVKALGEHAVGVEVQRGISSERARRLGFQRAISDLLKSYLMRVQLSLLVSWFGSWFVAGIFWLPVGFTFVLLLANRPHMPFEQPRGLSLTLSVEHEGSLDIGHPLDPKPKPWSDCPFGEEIWTYTVVPGWD